MTLCSRRGPASGRVGDEPRPHRQAKGETDQRMTAARRRENNIFHGNRGVQNFHYGFRGRLRWPVQILTAADPPSYHPIIGAKYMRLHHRYQLAAVSNQAILGVYAMIYNSQSTGSRICVLAKSNDLPIIRFDTETAETDSPCHYGRRSEQESDRVFSIEATLQRLNWTEQADKRCARPKLT